MDNLSIIAAIGKNNELGKDNHLLVHLREDLKFFKRTTTGKTIVMGRKTFDSLGRPLPNRKHIVLSRSDIDLGEDIEIVHSHEEAIERIKDIDDEVFVIGGGLIYRLFLDESSKLYLTEIEGTFDDADTYFPVFDKEQYDREEIDEIEENNISYKHVKYLRKKLQ